MQQFWIASLSTLTFIALGSSIQLVLENTEEHDWFWITNEPPGVLGWERLTTTPPRYRACDVPIKQSDPQPNSWLLSDQIAVSEANRIDIIVRYFIANCSKFSNNGGNYCVNVFDLYVHQSDHFIVDQGLYPDPLSNSVAYEKVTDFKQATDKITSETISVLVKGKHAILAFNNYGACSSLFSVKVTFNVCPDETLSDRLVSLSRTVAPANDSEPIHVEGNCSTDAVQVSGSLYVHCESNGEWNTSGLEGRCICKENMQNNGGLCEACPNGKYNDQRGLNCTVLPTIPRGIDVTFVNQSAVELRWLPPAITGDQTRVYYDVDCRMPCEDDDDKECLDEACESVVTYLPYKKGLNVTRVVVMSLSSFVNYSFKIYAKNRVTEVAKRRDGVERKFTTITVRTNGSTPGKPEVSVEQPEETVVVSWTLQAKNGVIKNYHVTYINEDDSSDIKSRTTQEIELQFDNLMAGKTYEFQVFAMNNIGKGPAGAKTFTLRAADSKIAMYLNIIYGFVGLVGLLIVLIVSFACHKILKRRRRQEKVKQNKLSVTAQSGVRVYDDITMLSMAAYQNVDDICDGFNLDRDQITLVRLLGTGNFGQVSKAIYGASHSEVAVKSLKDNASPKDLQDILSELDVMKSLQPHPQVVRLIGCCIEKEPMLIVLEYLPYGDLLGYLRKSRGHEDTYNTGEKRPNSRLSEKDLLSFAWMIADGMSYLATMKVVHRDLAARNVLVGENKVCKISDFGLARGLKEDVYTRRTQARLPVKWMPPESLFYGESTTMSDVWSYGIVMWEVFTVGESPYPGVPSRKMAGLLQTGYRMPRPRHISAELYSIMTECWEEKPQKRPTFRWLCSAVRRLLDDHKTYVNLEVYDDKDYVNFDVVT